MGDYKQGRSKTGEEDVNSDDLMSVSSPTGSGDRVKLFCSHGGKILPRPSDGTLKYVGGETRVVAIPRSITFSELMEKINRVFDGEYILKYQIAAEDLDSLVSVKSDEDIRHFVDEYDRLEREGVSKLRTYLFPLKSEIQTPLSVLGPNAIEQRFVDAINGIVRPSAGPTTTAKPLTVLKSISSSPTDGASPQSLSPRSIAAAMNQDYCNLANVDRMARFHRVQSSPANLGHIPPHGGQFSPSPQHQWFHPGYQYPANIAPPQDTHHLHHGYQSRTPRHQSPTSPQDHHVPQHRQSPTRAHVQVSVGSEYSAVPPLAHGPMVGHHNPSYHHPMLRPYPGSGGHRKWGHLEQYATASARADGLPRSPG